MSVKIGKYDVLEILGKGGMGVVYKAYDPILDREVALKTMTVDALKDPVMRERFYREARAAGKLRHPNIVTIYELGEENNMPFIAMEYLHGDDVYHMIRMREEVSLEKKFSIVIQLCRGLAYAHKAGIVHRDIKPSNIQVLDDFSVKILDFGIARLVTSHTMTSDGMVLGTIHYMSPEQIRAAHVDGKSDIFAAGVILYELLTYKKPFEADNTASILYKIVSEPPLKMDPPLDEQFPVIRRVLDKSLDKDPARRYHSADEMADDLELFIRSFGPVRKTESGPTLEVALHQPTEETRMPTAGTRPPTPTPSDPRAVDLLRTAKRYIVEGHSIQALTSLKQALSIDPQNPEANQLLNMIENDFKKAESEELLKRGQQYLQEGRYDIALKAFEKLLKVNPNNTKARLMMDTIKNELMSNPEVEEKLARAKNSYAEKKYRAALSDVETILSIQPQHKEAQEIQAALRERMISEEFNEVMRMGDNFLREKEFDTAIKAFEKALKIYPQHPVATKRLNDAKAGVRRLRVEELILLGNKQMEIGNYDQACQSFSEIVEIDTNNETAKMVLSYLREKVKVDEVKQLLNLGWRTLMMDKHYEEVIRIGEKILNLDPHNAEAQSLISAARKELP